MRRRMHCTLPKALAALLVAIFAGITVSSSLVDVAQETPTKPPIEAFVADMKASPGFFSTYLKKDGILYLEVTKEHLGKDFLVVVQMARGIGESFLLTGYPLDSDLLQFRLRNDKVELWTSNPYFRAAEGTPLDKMVELGFRDSVRRTFAIAARDDATGRYIIDATGLFLSDWPNVSDYLPDVFHVGFRLDGSRSAIASVKGFPRNVEIEADLTFAATAPLSNVPSRFFAVLPDEKSLPVALHYSVLALPDEPMKSRVADDRVGYFTTTYKDYSRQIGPTNAVRLVNRWRLEKKDPYAPTSEPIKPIIFYLENTIPLELRPYAKAGVEAWKKAYESAGFKNAIIALDQPNDPNWDPGDARYSTIRWMPSVAPIFGAMGPSDVDPRSGEILNADILIDANIVRGLNNEYLHMVENPIALLREEIKIRDLARLLNPASADRLCFYQSARAPHAALLHLTLMADGVAAPEGEMPLEYIGPAVTELVMHEVGHTLGLRHNFKASIATPYDQLHNPEFTKKNGLTASVMEYNPPNIAVDPTQQGEYFHSIVGTYDVWAIQWGYKPVGNETIALHPELQAIAQEHGQREHLYGTDEDAWLYPYALDPDITQFDLGSDPIAYYRDLQKLVARLWAKVEDRVLASDEEYWPLRSAVNVLLFEELQGYLYSVKALGGVEVTRAHQGDTLTPLKVMPAKRQREALRFILEAFRPELTAHFPKQVLDKMPRERWWDWASTWQVGQRFHFPIHDSITGMRAEVISFAFAPERLLRVRDNAYRSDESDPFTLDELFTGFTEVIWADVLDKRAPTDSFQRAIQSIYVDQLIALLIDESPTRVSDVAAMAYAELARLDQAISDLLVEGVKDPLARAHVLEVQHRIRGVVDTEQQND